MHGLGGERDRLIGYEEARLKCLFYFKSKFVYLPVISQYRKPKNVKCLRPVLRLIGSLRRSLFHHSHKSMDSNLDGPRHDPNGCKLIIAFQKGTQYPHLWANIHLIIIITVDSVNKLASMAPINHVARSLVKYSELSAFRSKKSFRWVRYRFRRVTPLILYPTDGKHRCIGLDFIFEAIDPFNVLFQFEISSLSLVLIAQQNQESRRFELTFCMLRRTMFKYKTRSQCLGGNTWNSFKRKRNKRIFHEFWSFGKFESIKLSCDKERF